MIEPVAWLHREGENTMSAITRARQDQWIIDEHWADATPLYAIPPGYALVPVEQVKDARLLAWLLEKHGEQIRQILWSYDQCCSDEINALGVKAMLTAAAKGE